MVAVGLTRQDQQHVVTGAGHGALSPLAALPGNTTGMVCGDGPTDGGGGDGWRHGLGEGEDAQARCAGEPVPRADHGICCRQQYNLVDRVRQHKTLLVQSPR